MRTAALFPGHGSQEEDPTETLARVRPDLLELAYAQPATYCASLAGWSLLGPEHVDVLVGHSLGELSALAAAAAVDQAAGLWLVALHGLVKRTLDGVEAATARRLAGAGV